MDSDNFFYKELLNQITEHICVIDEQGNILYTNHAWDSFGRANNAGTKSWLNLNYFDACEKSIAQGDEGSKIALIGIKEVIKGERAVFYYEYPCHSDNEKRWFLMTVKRLENSLLPRCFISHQQFQAESELRLYQERLALATDAGKIGVWDLNLESNELFWDSMMYQVYGMEPEQFGGIYLAWKQCLHPEDRERAEQEFLNALNHGKAYDSTFRIITPKHQIKHIAANASLIKDEHGIPCRMVGINYDITESIEQKHKIEAVAYTDTLTNLPNRNRLIADFKYLNDQNSYIGLLLLDIKNFRALNDTYGHDFGDDILIKLASTIALAAPRQAKLYRLGGDEFIVQLFADKTATLQTLLPQLFEQIKNQIKQCFFLSLHAGIAILKNESLSFSEAMQKVDFALNECKSTNKIGCTMYNEEINQKYSRAIAITQALNSPTCLNELSIEYQIQHHETYQAVGAECLLRWHHPELGPISPAEFIPIAEKTGDIIQIGHWVIEQAFTTLASWKNMIDFAEYSLSINISPRQIYSADFFDEVESLLKHYQINPKLVKFEITEGVLLKNTQMAIDVIQRFRELGIEFALDDFGTGFSSLSYLKKFPIDIVKIDKSFVDNVISDTTDQAVIRSVVSLCRGLNVSLITEGIENELQHQKIRELGCSFYQGYWFGKPMKLLDFEQFVLEQQNKPKQANKY
ncbi:EAL domain-containing protein [Catenovulum sp. SM1970]|uniref:EAL domain-containing protein n=1 Tax=Marinifaba aquimaris TaxID=2741323 RepID=UPI001573BF22|nr:EAL domain-containing protein [Marinifaba aquimaris]NTS76692.1 EAL domain-containing protein [Marinifaba aquimaris]